MDKVLDLRAIDARVGAVNWDKLVAGETRIVMDVLALLAQVRALRAALVGINTDLSEAVRRMGTALGRDTNYALPAILDAKQRAAVVLASVIDGTDG
jgi:hypothetical protein